MDTPDDWDEEQNRLFIAVYRFLIANQKSCTHPDSHIPVDQWQTICHNAAWAAVELLDYDEISIIDSDTGEIIAHSPIELNS